MASSHVFLHNPKAGSQDHRIIEELRLTLGQRYKWIETSGPGEARTLTIDAVRNGATTVVSIGGDGTVFEIVNGLMSFPKEQRPSFGLIPTGSGNDFAYGCGISADPRKAVDIILEGKSSAVDIGWLSGAGKKVYWANSLGIGFDANVTIQSKKFHTLSGFTLYFISTLATLMKHHEVMDLELVLDSLRFSEKALMVTLGNGPREGGGFNTTPGATNDDGLFNLLLIKPLGRLGLFALLPKVMKGSHLTSPSIYHRTFSRMQLRAKEPISIHVDGEIFSSQADGVTEIIVGLEAGALNVLKS